MPGVFSSLDVTSRADKTKPRKPSELEQAEAVEIISEMGATEKVFLTDEECTQAHERHVYYRVPFAVFLRFFKGF